MIDTYQPNMDRLEKYDFELGPIIQYSEHNVKDINRLIRIKPDLLYESQILLYLWIQKFNVENNVTFVTSDVKVV